MTKQHILITGGSGLIGKRLTNQLLAKGYSVSHLSRSAGQDARVKTFLWNISAQTIDENCLNEADTIIHLAGAGIADKLWTAKRKKEIIDSRVDSVKLLYNLIGKQPNKVKHFISASATGYYSDRGDELLTEDSQPASDFLSHCCAVWEQAVDAGKQLGLKVAKLRTGVVLTTEGGALVPLAIPVKIGLGAALGSGKQWIPWIHLQDAVDMYLFALEHPEFEGIYNMVAPNPVTNRELTKAVAKQLSRPFWMPNVPAFLLKFIFGEMSAVVLGSTKVSAQKIEDAGFKFKYPEVSQALKELYG